MGNGERNDWQARPKAVAIDLTLIYLFLLMAEFLAIAFSGRKASSSPRRSSTRPVADTNQPRARPLAPR